MKTLVHSNPLAIVFTFLFSASAVALKPVDSWQPLPPFSGGINIMVGKALVPDDQVIEATNFIWRDGALQGRDGFYRFADPVSANGVSFIDIFSKSSGADYLMYSDAASLWYRSGLTDAATALEFGRNNRGIVDTYGTAVQGDSIAVQKWRTLMGTGEGGTITVDGTDYVISAILLDTLIYLTTTAGNLTDKSYNLDYNTLSISSGLVVSDNYWIYSNVGKFYFNQPDSFVIVDSLTGLRFSYTAVRRKCNTTPVLEFTSAAVTTDYAGKFLRIVTNPFSAGGTANPVTAGHPFYMSYPIRSSGSGKVTTWAPAFIPDSTTAQYFTAEELIYDSTTIDVVRLDSIRLAVMDSAAFSCAGTSNALYLKLYAAEFDSSDFITGDWFFYPRFNFKAYSMNYDSVAPYSYLDLPTAPMKVFPVVGGFVATDGAVYVAWPGLWTSMSRDDTTEYYIRDTNNVDVTFYRMKKNTTGNRTGGYITATLHKDRVFEVRVDNPDRIYWSEPFLPDSFFAGSVTIIDQQHPITVASEQFGELVVYTTTGRWKMFPDETGTLFGKEKLDGTRGCVAKGSFLNVDGVHYGLAADGYWQSDGGEPQIISGDVAAYFTDSISTTDYASIATGYDAENDNIWISVPTRSWTLVYHRETKSWWRQSFVAGCYAYNPEVSVSDSVRFIAGGTDSSTIYVRGTRKDDGAAFTATLQTSYLDFDQPQLAKRLKGALIEYDALAASAVSVIGYRDFATTAFDTLTFTTDAVWSQKLLWARDARFRGNNLSLKFKLTDAGQLRLLRLNLLVVPEGIEE